MKPRLSNNKYEKYYIPIDSKENFTFVLKALKEKNYNWNGGDLAQKKLNKIQIETKALVIRPLNKTIQYAISLRSQIDWYGKLEIVDLFTNNIEL